MRYFSLYENIGIYMPLKTIKSYTILTGYILSFTNIITNTHLEVRIVVILELLVVENYKIQRRGEVWCVSCRFHTLVKNRLRRRRYIVIW